MKNLNAWIVNNTEACLPNPNTQVSIFVIGRRKPVVESVEASKQIAPNHQECSRTEGYISSEHVRTTQRRMSASIAGARSIGPNDATGFLQHIVRQNDPPSNCADARIDLNGVERVFERAGPEHGVIVEKDDDVAATLKG